MAALTAVSLVFAVLTIWFLLHLLHCLRRGRLLRAGGSGVGCLSCAAIAGAGGMLVLSYASYSRLIDEQLVSRIEFRRVADEEYEARLMIPEKNDEFFILRGDEWQIDARILTWKPPLTIVGLQPVYQLDRLSGRFTDIARERSENRTVHALTPPSPADIWAVARRYPVLLPGVDAHYGTATYVPMADGARFEVTISRDALIARPANDKAADAVGAWQSQRDRVPN
jgi:hypothetical protein